jgi:hypothetical protein
MVSRVLPWVSAWATRRQTGTGRRVQGQRLHRRSSLPPAPLLHLPPDLPLHPFLLVQRPVVSLPRQLPFLLTVPVAQLPALRAWGSPKESAAVSTTTVAPAKDIVAQDVSPVLESVA